MININWKPSRKDLRIFALACLVVTVGAGIVLYQKNGPSALVKGLWTVGPLVAILGLAWPPSVRYLYLGLSLLAFPIGLVIGNVLMAVIYYLVVTPIGLVFRLIGRDSLHRKLDRDAPTHWIQRPPAPPVRRYFRQH